MRHSWSRSRGCSWGHSSVMVVALGLACGPGDTGESAGSSTGGEASSEGSSSGSSGATAGSETTTSTGPTGTGTGMSMSGSSTDATATTDPTEGTSGTTEGTSTGGVMCMGGGLGPGDHDLEIEHGGLTRTLRLHIPPSYDGSEASPLVVNFHGLTSNVQEQVFFSGMNKTADAEGFMVAYPQGYMDSWNAGVCCGGAESAMIDDVGFVRALIETLEGATCIDPARIFATGMSNGGFMTHRLACEASDLFAAFAPVSSVLLTEPCEPERPVPIMMFNGTSDTLVPYEGGLFLGAVETFESWAAKGGCAGAPALTFAKGAATCQTYQECAEGAEVTLCTIDPMGHCWPGTAFCPF
ncbi:MAG TPA: hypothetical protein ENK31_06530, partial [Nannocystis exedens]|nr:hypothetical protein [Nannocystis exedens]